MIVVGDNEMSSSNVSLRLRNGEGIGSQTLSQVKARIREAIESKC